MSTRRSGFTFVELLVAMAVFSVLSAVAVPRIRLMQQRGYTATLKADLGELRIAQESYWAENQVYSTDPGDLDWRATSDVVVQINSSDLNAGFQATARHLQIPDQQCNMYLGRETIAGVPSGEIVCGPAGGIGSGSGTSGAGTSGN